MRHRCRGDAAVPHASALNSPAPLSPPPQVHRSHLKTADTERPSVLIRLLRTYLRPYKKPIGLLVLLQFLQTCASLYLPTLNAHIIDNGVVKGDTGYILSFGALMIGISLAQVVCNIGAVYYGARTASAV